MPVPSNPFSPVEHEPFLLGEWRVDPATGQLTADDRKLTLEPQLMSLLLFLSAEPGKVLSRHVIEQALWSEVVVGEDTVARAISRLRQALGDSARSPQYIETLPKRGYRLIAAVSAPDETAQQSPQTRKPRVRLNVIAGIALLAIAAILTLLFWNSSAPQDAQARYVARADDLYMRFTRADNEAAIGLYERVLAVAPQNADAQAGLANALVQRVVRYPGNTALTGASSIAEALDRGLMQGADAVAVLERARAMAERAVQLDPDNADAIKSLAFVHTAQGDLDTAESLYQDVLALDENAWAALINLGEISQIRGASRDAIQYFERAWAAMSRAYEYEPQRVGPWQVALGVVIGESHESLEQLAEAELWYRQVLAQAPYEPEATIRLARILHTRGDAGEARSLCQALIERLGEFPRCSVVDSPQRD